MFWRVAIFWSAFILGPHAIGYFGSFYVNKATGYEIGNRRRLIAVLKLEWISFLLSFLVYAHLFSIFQPPYTIFNVNGKNEHLKRRLRRAFVILMFLSNVVYLFYFTDVPWILFEFCALLQGIWLHLVFFSMLFICLNYFVYIMNLCSLGQRCLNFIYNCSNWIKRVCCESQLQVFITLICTLLLCLIQWYASDKIVIKELTIPLRGIPIGSPPLKLAVISDLHGGGAVYREEIAKVVDKTNTLNADAVLLIGDAVDAPRSSIESRMEPLKYLHSRLGTFFVTGNHEYYYGSEQEWIDLFKSYGMKILQNQIASLDGVCLVGLNDISSENSGIPNHNMNVSAISECRSNSSIVVMAHNPAAANKIIQYGNSHSLLIELILSGHTHAAQYYILVPYVMLFLPYWHGQYIVNYNTTVFVSAGTLYQAAPMKMWGMSEIWLLTLTSQ